MTTHNVKPISKPGFFTAFVFDNHIDCLIRSADWYTLPPIQRYLYNMAASEIRMEDAKTETRVYTFERFESLRLLIERSAGQEFEVATEAWVLWGDRDVGFGVVHLDQTDGRRGNLLVGDDPHDIDEFAPVEPGEDVWTTNPLRRVVIRPEDI